MAKRTQLKTPLEQANGYYKFGKAYRRQKKFLKSGDNFAKAAKSLEGSIDVTAELVSVLYSKAATSYKLGKDILKAGDNLFAAAQNASDFFQEKRYAQFAHGAYIEGGFTDKAAAVAKAYGLKTAESASSPSIGEPIPLVAAKLVAARAKIGMFALDVSPLAATRGGHRMMQFMYQKAAQPAPAQSS